MDPFSGCICRGIYQGSQEGIGFRGLVFPRTTPRRSLLKETRSIPCKVRLGAFVPCGLLRLVVTDQVTYSKQR